MGRRGVFFVTFLFRLSTTIVDMMVDLVVELLLYCLETAVVFAVYDGVFRHLSLRFALG